MALHNILILYLSAKIFLRSFLVTIMGLVIPWSITLALIDIYSLLIHCPIRQPGIFFFIVLGDWVCLALLEDSTFEYVFFLNYKHINMFLQALSFLTLAAASSIAGIVDVLHRADETFCPAELCSRYQISAGLSFLSWFLSMASSLSNLWLLPSLTRWYIHTYIHHHYSTNNIFQPVIFLYGFVYVAQTLQNCNNFDLLKSPSNINSSMYIGSKYWRNSIYFCGKSWLAQTILKHIVTQKKRVR